MAKSSENNGHRRDENHRDAQEQRDELGRQHKEIDGISNLQDRIEKLNAIYRCMLVFLFLPDSPPSLVQELSGRPNLPADTISDALCLHMKVLHSGARVDSWESLFGECLLLAAGANLTTSASREELDRAAGPASGAGPDTTKFDPVTEADRNGHDSGRTDAAAERNGELGAAGVDRSAERNGRHGAERNGQPGATPADPAEETHTRGAGET
jgi:hypothetical protein